MILRARCARGRRHPDEQLGESSQRGGLERTAPPADTRLPGKDELADRKSGTLPRRLADDLPGRVARLRFALRFVEEALGMHVDGDALLVAAAPGIVARLYIRERAVERSRVRATPPAGGCAAIQMAIISTSPVSTGCPEPSSGRVVPEVARTLSGLAWNPPTAQDRAPRTSISSSRVPTRTPSTRRSEPSSPRTSDSYWISISSRCLRPCQCPSRPSPPPPATGRNRGQQVDLAVYFVQVPVVSPAHALIEHPMQLQRSTPRRASAPVAG